MSLECGRNPMQGDHANPRQVVPQVEIFKALRCIPVWFCYVPVQFCAEKKKCSMLFFSPCTETGHTDVN